MAVSGTTSTRTRTPSRAPTQKTQPSSQARSTQKSAPTSAQKPQATSSKPAEQKAQQVQQERAQVDAQVQADRRQIAQQQEQRRIDETQRVTPAASPPPTQGVQRGLSTEGPSSTSAPKTPEGYTSPEGSVSKGFSEQQYQSYAGKDAQLGRPEVDAYSRTLKDDKASVEQQREAAQKLGDDAMRGNAMAAIGLQQGYASSQVKDEILQQSERLEGRDRGLGNESNQSTIDHNRRLLQETAAGEPARGRRGIADTEQISSRTSTGLKTPSERATTEDLHKNADKSLAQIKADGKLTAGEAEWMRRTAQHQNADPALHEKLHAETKDLKLPGSYRDPRYGSESTQQRVAERTERIDTFRDSLAKASTQKQANAALDQMSRDLDPSTLDGQRAISRHYPSGSEKFNAKVDQHFEQNPAERSRFLDDKINDLRSDTADAEDRRQAGDALVRNAGHLTKEQLDAVTEGNRAWRLGDDPVKREIVSKALTESSDPATRTAAAKKLLDSQMYTDRGATRDPNFESVVTYQPTGLDLSPAEKTAIANEVAANPQAFQGRGNYRARRTLEALKSSPMDGAIGDRAEKARDGAKHIQSQEFRDSLKMQGDRRTTPGEARSEAYQEELSRIRENGGRAAADRADQQFRQQNQQYADTLGSSSATAAEKQKAAQNLAAAPPETMSKQQLESLKTFAAQEGDRATRRMTLEHMKNDGPLGQDTLERAGKAAQTKIQEAITNAPKGSELHKLGEALRARAMADDPEFKDRVKPGAREKLDAEIQRLQEGPAGDQLKKIAQEARDEVFGNRDIAQEQADYLRSDKFKQQLEVAGTDDMKAEVLNRELTKLKAVNPQAAQKVANELGQEMMQEKMLDGVRGLDGEQGQNAVQSALKDVLGDAGVGNKVAKKLADSLQDAATKADNVMGAGERALKRISTQIQDLQNALADAKKVGDADLVKKLSGELSTSQKALAVLNKLNQNGKLGTFGAAVGIHSLATGGFDFSNVQNGASTMSTLAGIAGSSDDVLKLAGWATGKFGAQNLSSVLGKAGNGLGALKAFKALGPAGDVFSAVSEGAHAWGEFQRGDIVGGAFSTAATAGYTTAAGLGIAAIALGSGPIGWAALGVGLGAMALSGAGSWFGESDEESFLRRGVTDKHGNPIAVI